MAISHRPVPALAAGALTGLRVALSVPMAVLMADPRPQAATATAAVLGVGVATDLADGPAARAAGVAGRCGQVFDHGADCLFVTAAMIGAARRGALPWPLPVLVVGAFVQYVVDSRRLAPGSGPRGSRLGRANGVLYFAVPAVDVLARRGVLAPGVTSSAGWALAVSTCLSMGQRLSWVLGSRPAAERRPVAGPPRSGH